MDDLTSFFVIIINVNLLLFLIGYNSPVKNWRKVEYYISSRYKLIWCGPYGALIRVPYWPFYISYFSNHVSIYSNTLLSRYLITRIWYIHWCTNSTGALDCWFLISMQTVFITKSFSKEVRLFLSSDPLSNTTLNGLTCQMIYQFIHHSWTWPLLGQTSECWWFCTSLSHVWSPSFRLN